MIPVVLIEVNFPTKLIKNELISKFVFPFQAVFKYYIIFVETKLVHTLKLTNQMLNI